MNAHKIIILSAVVYSLGSAESCVITDAKQCFTAMGEKLGLTSNQLGGNELFNYVNPANADNQQAQTCSALEGQDFSSVLTCLQSASCADASILSPEIANQPGVPVITWSSILDLLQGLCKPGCENLVSQNEKVQQCNSDVAGGSGGCSDLSELFSCFRGAIGSCEVLVTFTEGLLQSTGVFDTVEQQCPDINLALSGCTNHTGCLMLTLVLVLITLIWTLEQ